MAASTITRSTWTDGAAGTVVNNARLQADVYDRVDALFTAAFTFGATLAVEGFGSHTFSAGGTGSNAISVRNTTAGTGNLATVNVGNDAASDALLIGATSSTFTASGDIPQDGALLRCSRAGGIALSTNHASGSIRFHTGASFVERARINTTSLLLPDGVAATPGVAFLSDVDTGLFLSGGGICVSLSGALRQIFAGASGAFCSLSLSSSANGTGVGATGNVITLGRNSSGGTAPGLLHLTRADDLAGYLWTDNSGNVRTHTAAPDESTGVTIGTVVGTQTSRRSTKHIYGEYTDHAGALALLRRTPLWDFDYNNGGYQQTRFVGITTDDSPEFGMDAGQSFNPVSAFGYTVAAIKALAAKVEALEAAA